MMKIFIQTADGSNWDVTSVAGNIGWRYELEALAGEFNFSVKSNQFGVGDKVLVKSKNYIVFQGMIVSESGKHTKDFTCLDFGFNLNKNEIIVQFNKVSVKQAIIQMCHKLNIDVEIPDIATKVTKLYKDQPVSDIIKDLLSIATLETNNKYYMRVFGKVLAIRTFHREPIEVFNISTDYSLDKSIENLYNQVVIVGDGEKETRTVATEKDAVSIKRYGTLQLIETVSKEEKSKANNMAKNKLKEVNKIEQNFSITCDGNYHLVSGRIARIKHPELKGDYLIKEVTHEYKNPDNYRCSLTLERWVV